MKSKTADMAFCVCPWLREKRLRVWGLSGSISSAGSSADPETGIKDKYNPDTLSFTTQRTTSTSTS